MLTPKELYEAYSISPCSPYAGGSTAYLDNGRGTPFDIKRIIKFLKHVKYPCYNSVNAQGESIHANIDGTGNKKLALTFKFLEEFDREAFAEGQPQIESGTAYAIRNCADVSRACYHKINNSPALWYARMATEYLEHFGNNSIPDCLMILGPNLVDEPTAYDRTPSSMGCFYYGASARFFCYQPPGDSLNNPPICVCGVAPIGAADVDPCLDNPDPCCQGEPAFENDCCTVGRTRRKDFSYTVPLDDMGGPTESFILKHIGILERKDYGGYANFVSRSGRNFHATLDDIFLNYFQTINGYDYTNNTSSDTGSIYRCQTISTILDVTRNKTSITTNTTSMINSIKDLIYNGYGVVLFSNVGFPNIRDSSGLCYPDRIWYQTYGIIGYDDRKTEYQECVYVLSCPFGDWITGGQPSWGPLPPGCFLVTESHLKCMINFYPGLDFYDCRKKPCNPNLYDCEDPFVRTSFAGCGASEELKCTPYYCTQQQSAFGMLFAISLSDGFPRQDLPHTDFYPVTTIKQLFQEQTVYFDARN